MSAVGDIGPATGWGSFGAALRLIVGWFSIAIAVLNLLAELGRVPERPYLLFHAMLLAGGLLLISFGRGAAGTPMGYAAGGAVLAGGMLAGALPVNAAACCLGGFAVRHGYPFSFLARNEGGRWHVDSPHLLADLLFWGYAGLIVLVAVVLTRRVTRHRGGAGR